jgi:hypothetical protein
MNLLKIENKLFDAHSNENINKKTNNFRYRQDIVSKMYLKNIEYKKGYEIHQRKF